MSPNRSTFPLRLALTLLGCTASLSALATEAGVDNIQIHTGNPIPCDFDGSGAVGVADLFGFLDTWFTEFATPGAGLGSDFNYDGGVGVADLFQFLDCWFANFN